MKKLMLLGGARYLKPVIDKAHELGIYVITCDYLPHNYAHKYSDEYINISIIEKEKVLEAAQNANIDGIMSFATDPGVVTAAYVAEKMNLPFAGSYESVLILQNKGKFRKFLKENSFNVPMHGSYENVEQALSEMNNFTFPIIVKPVDSAGSKGVMRIDTVDGLKKAAEYALKYSIEKKFIVEEFIEKDGFSSDCDCFSVDGEFKFISFSDQRFDENAKNPYTPAAYSWPPNMKIEHQRELCSELQRLADLLKLKTSIYNVETRVGTNGKPYIMEVSPRGGGNRLAEMIYYATGADIIRNAVLSSVGFRCEQIKEPIYDGYLAEIILHSKSDGIFSGLKINDRIIKNVIESDIWVKPGEAVEQFKGANDAIGTLVFRFDTKSELELVLSNIDEYIDVIVK